MYRFYFLFLTLLLAYQASFTQQRSEYQSSRPYVLKPQAIANRAADTVLFTNLAPQDSNFFTFTYEFQDVFQGFVTGHNQFGDQGFAERFDNNSSIRVLSGFVFVVGSVTNPTDIGQFNIYQPETADPLSKPGQQIGSTSLPYGQLNLDNDTEDAFFLFENPPQVNGDFFAAFELSPYNIDNVVDSLSILHTGDSTRALTDTLVCRNVVKWDDGSWHDFFQEEPGILFKLAIAVIVEFPEVTSNDDFIANRGLKLRPAYPNPAKDLVSLRISLDRPDDVAVQLYDLQGKEVYSKNMGKLTEGEQTLELDLGDLGAGTYLYTIKTSEACLGSRLTIF